jgi:hypothetical protein
LTVKVAVAVVELSVTVIVQAAEPAVSTALAAVFELTVGVARLSPLQPPPLRLNSVLAVSVDQSVFVPVRVRLGVVLVLPEVGEIESVAVATEIVALIESVVSEMVRVPVPELVVMTSVCDVAELLVELTRVTPETPESEKDVLPVHAVSVPVSVRVIFPLWFAGTTVGEAVKLGLLPV